MVECLLNNVLLNFEEYLEHFEENEVDFIDIVANCNPNVRAIARVDFDGVVVIGITYILATGAIFDEDYDCINDEDEEMEERIITKKEFDKVVENACKWVIE